MASILARQGFRRLLGARFPSQLADGWFQAGLAGSLLFNPSRQTGAVAIAVGFAILLLPYSLLGPYVGVFLDRWDRRAALAATNLARAALVLPAALLMWHDAHGVGYALLALLVIALNRFFLAGINAALPRVVPEAQLVTANAIAATLGTVSYAAGLFCAATVIALGPLGTDAHGYGVLAAAGAAGYLASAVAAWAAFRRGQLGPDPHERPATGTHAAVLAVAHGMISGVRHLIDRRVAGYALLAQAGHRMLYGAVTLTVLLLFRGPLADAGPATADADAAGLPTTADALWALGQVILAGAIGAGVAAVVTPPLTRRWGGHRWVTILLATVGAIIFALGMPFQAVLMVIAAFGVNSASHSIKIVIDATLQRECDDDYRGRVFSINDTAYHLTFVGGLFLAAWALPPDGRSAAAVVLVAAGYGLLALWYGRWARPARVSRLPAGTGS